MTRPDPNNADVTLARVAHSYYIWNGVRMIAPSIYREMVGADMLQSAKRAVGKPFPVMRKVGGARSVGVAAMAMMQREAVTSAYTQGRAPGVVS